MAPTKLEPIGTTDELSILSSDWTLFKRQLLLEQSIASKKLLTKYNMSKATMKSFSYQARKPLKRETIMTRIYTCRRDFEPIKIT